MRSVVSSLLLLVTLLAVSCGGSGVDGTYVPDEDAVRAAIKEWLSQNPMPGVSEEELDARIDAQMAERSMELVVSPDGTFTFTATVGPESMESKGTWERDGTELKMVTTHENGTELAEGETVTAEFADDRITLQEKMPYPVVLERK